MLWSVPCTYTLEPWEYFYRMASQKWDRWSEGMCILHFDRCLQIILKKVPIYISKKCINMSFPAPSLNGMLLIFWFLSILWVKKEISLQLVLTRVWRSLPMFLGYILGSMHCLLRSFFTELLVFPLLIYSSSSIGNINSLPVMYVARLLSVHNLRYFWHKDLNNFYIVKSVYLFSLCFFEFLSAYKGLSPMPNFTLECA